jgi:hypothetical protein
MNSVPTTLANLVLSSPTLANGVNTLSVDTSALQFVVLGDLSTVAVDIVIADILTTLTNPTVVNGQNQFAGSVSVPVSAFAQPVQVTGRNYVTTPVAPVLRTQTIQFEVLYQQSSLAVSITAPSGITISKGASACQIEWVLPTYAGFTGVRVMYSTDASGVTTPYTQFGNLVNTVSRSANVALSAPQITTQNAQATDGSTNRTLTTTSVSTVAPVNFSSASIPQSTVNADVFYVVLTTVVTDPTSGTVYESQAAGPFTCGYVNLKQVAPTDFLALQKSNDIATRMISEITRRRPDLDLTPRSEVRDLIIAPLALELANMSVREWFSRMCRSIDALAQLDDQNGDGISDPVSSSTLKQQIARAYGLSDVDFQTFLDSRFDINGANEGVTRGGATFSTVDATIYTYSRPTSVITIQAGAILSTIPDTTSTSAVTFVTRASATIDPSNLNAFYDAANGWWSVTVPAEAQTAGSIGNIGAKALRQITSGATASLGVTNLNASTPAVDNQSNADYAAMIKARIVAGKDSSTRSGYFLSARQVPGVTAANVVAAGDLDMVRDWLVTEQKHVGGCVDIYTRGDIVSQQAESVPFTYQSSSVYGSTSSYLSLSLFDATNLRFKVASSLTSPIMAAVEILVVSAGRTLYMGSANATFIDNIVTLDPTENVYTVNSDGSTSVWQVNGVNATNLSLVQSLGGLSSTGTYLMMARYQTGLNHQPALQPVSSVSSVSGPITGTINPANVVLYYTNDFLLTGGSNQAGDAVTVSGVTSAPITKTITIPANTTQTLFPIDTAMDVPLDSNGLPLDVLSVISASNPLLLFKRGVDYAIVRNGRYRSFAMKLVTGTGITSDVVVTYNKFILTENISLQTDTVTLNGSTPVTLSQGGFVQNSWLPASHGLTALLLDGYQGAGVTPLAFSLMGGGVAPASRYIKIANSTSSNLTVIPVEGRDFTLTVDPNTGAATVARVIGGKITDGSTVTVTYYYAESLSVLSNYPAYVQQVLNQITPTQNAAANVLVKAMVPSPVDITLVVSLDSATAPSDVDGPIRTAIDYVMLQSQQSMSMSQVVRAVQQITGITGVGLPLLKCAKSDGSYDIASVIPSGTAWTPLAHDPAFTGLGLPVNAFITAVPVLQNATIPSGGTANAYVGLLYEGQSFRRAMTITDFLTSTTPSFYIVGAADATNATVPFNSTYVGRILLTNVNGADPGLLPYRCTYQCFGETGAKNITTASSEYLVAGTVNILYQ